jgi:hypothetical protein
VERQACATARRAAESKRRGEVTTSAPLHGLSCCPFSHLSFSRLIFSFLFSLCVRVVCALSAKFGAAPFSWPLGAFCGLDGRPSLSLSLSPFPSIYDALTVKVPVRRMSAEEEPTRRP